MELFLFGEADADVGDAGEDLAFHVVADSDAQPVALSEAEGGEGEGVLVMADAVALGVALFVDEAAGQGVGEAGGVRFEDGLFDDEVEGHEGVVATDAQADVLDILSFDGDGRGEEGQRVVLLPSRLRGVLIVVVDGLVRAGRHQDDGNVEMK